MRSGAGLASPVVGAGGSHRHAVDWRCPGGLGPVPEVHWHVPSAAVRPHQAAILHHTHSCVCRIVTAGGGVVQTQPYFVWCWSEAVLRTTMTYTFNKWNNSSKSASWGTPLVDVSPVKHCPRFHQNQSTISTIALLWFCHLTNPLPFPPPGKLIVNFDQSCILEKIIRHSKSLGGMIV